LNPKDVAQLAEVRRAGVEQAAGRFESFRQQHEGRQDLAWWPAHPEPDPCGPANLFFYRPGELLVRADALPKVIGVLQVLGVKTCIPENPETGKRDPVVQILVASRDPVPVLLRQLRCYGLGLDVVGPNHVFFPSTGDSLHATPWFSGGAGSLPKQVGAGTAIPPQLGGSGPNVAVFDSNLLDRYLTLPTPPFGWLHNVSSANQPLEPTPALLDIYDNHGLFVAGIIGYTATAAQVKVRGVLAESGEVDDGTLAQEINQYLPASGAHLVNLSLGGTTLCGAPPLASTACIATHSTVVFVASAGNTGPGGSAFYPAALPQVVGVGALDGNAPAAFSNTDTRSAKVWARGVDVTSAFQPGVLRVPSFPDTVYNSGLAQWSGTSFSTPRVTGVLTDYLAQTAQPDGYGALAWLQQKYFDPATGMIIIP
jgi:hypothetical protein